MPADPVKQREYAKKHYAANKDRIKERAKAHKAANMERSYKYVNDLKEQTPCPDCEEYYPAICMDFDHIGDDKDRAIATLIRHNVKFERILAEIVKCEIVCSNCHRLRTHLRAKPEVGNGSHKAKRTGSIPASATSYPRRKDSAMTS